MGAGRMAIGDQQGDECDKEKEALHLLLHYKKMGVRDIVFTVAYTPYRLF